MSDIDLLLEQYQQQALDAINNKMKKKGVTQQALANDTHISQSTLSKLLSGNSKLTLEHIARIAIALHTNVSEFVSFGNLDVPLDNNAYSLDSIFENDNLVRDIKRLAFKGYIGNTYYLYFYSTISSETKLIHGELTIQASEENHCKIDLKLYTGKIDVSGEPMTKNYAGEMIISIPLSSCYCIVSNQEIGEICFITFHHRFFSDKNMLCRVGAVLTTSCGESRRPTLHRMVISRHKLNLDENSNDMHILKGQLKLNNSKITISRFAFDNMINCEAVQQSEELLNFFNEFQLHATKEEFYNIEENILLNQPANVNTKIQGISILREYSISDKYNKISAKTDEFLFEYISKIKSGNN